MVTVVLFIVMICVLIAAGCAQHQSKTCCPIACKSKNICKDARMEWWREARFGMFIHWGLYAVPAGEWKGKRIPGIGEWIMEKADIPVSEYEQLAKQFNPIKFDAEQWVQIAKNAGMKYIVIN